MRKHKQWRDILWLFRLTTATPCFMVRQSRRSTSYNERRTTWRVICQCKGQSDARPLLRSLHWLPDLPVRHHITYKTAVLAHKVLATLTPAYLSNITSLTEPTRHLRSARAPLLSVSTTTAIARCAFSVAAPSVWNSLPDNIYGRPPARWPTAIIFYC